MRRRDFIKGIAGSTTAWPLVARAQQPAMPVVGFINPGTADASTGRIAAFRKGLSEAGYAEGQNVTVEYHWLEGHYDRLPAVVTDLAQRRVAVIATPASVEAALAAKTATTTIPIVFGVSEDRWCWASFRASHGQVVTRPGSIFWSKKSMPSDLG